MIWPALSWRAPNRSRKKPLTQAEYLPEWIEQTKSNLFVYHQTRPLKKLKALVPAEQTALKALQKPDLGSSWLIFPSDPAVRSGPNALASCINFLTSGTKIGKVSRPRWMASTLSFGFFWFHPFSQPPPPQKNKSKTKNGTFPPV